MIGAGIRTRTGVPGVRQPVVDTFNRANGSVGAADSGQAWTFPVGTASSISSNQLICPDSSSIAMINSGVSDCLVAGMVNSPGANNFSLVVRYASTTSYLLVNVANATTIQVITRNPSFSTLATYTVSLSYPFEIGCRMKGNSISALVNRQALGTVTSSINASAVSHGLSSATWDDFRVYLA